MINEEFNVIDIESGKYLFGTFDKKEAICKAKLIYGKSNKEIQVNRTITLIDCIYNSKHPENESQFKL